MTEIFDNIRKIYRFSSPGEELENYIDFFSESSLEHTVQLMATEKFTVKMFQSWTPTFWFTLGAPYYLECHNKQQIVKPEDDILVLRDTAVTRYVSSSDCIFTVKFFPGGLEAILGIKQAQLIGKIIPLSAIIPPALIRRVKTALSYEARIQLLQDYFLANLKQKPQKDYYLQFVKDTIDCYETNNLVLNTSQMAEKMFITSKTINRYFHNVVGISPKKYFSVARARIALTHFVADKKAFDPCQFGYYDMSHFYKGISCFTGHNKQRHSA